MGKDRGQVDLQLDLEKPKIESLSSSKSESQQPKATKVENRQDKAGICSLSHFVEFSHYFLDLEKIHYLFLFFFSLTFFFFFFVII